MTAKHMDLQDLLVTAKTRSFDKLAPKLNIFIREHSNFQNLDEGNRKLVLDLIKKYLPRIHNGVGISAMNMREEMHHLYENRIKLNLKESDLEDIKEIMALFTK